MLCTPQIPVTTPNSASNHMQVHVDANTVLTHQWYTESDRWKSSPSTSNSTSTTCHGRELISQNWSRMESRISMSVSTRPALVDGSEFKRDSSSGAAMWKVGALGVDAWNTKSSSLSSTWCQRNVCKSPTQSIETRSPLEITGI